MKTAVVASMVLASSVTALSGSDLSRAEQIVPRAAFRGTGFSDTANTLSALMKDSLAFSTKPCADFSLDELNDLYRAVLQSVNPDLDSVYTARGDPRALRLKDVTELESRLADEHRHLSAVDDSEKLIAVARDGKCAELAMMLTHHLEESAREELGELFTMPELSATKHAFVSNESDAHQAVHARYQEQATCAICHEDQADTSNPQNAPLSWGAAHLAYQQEGGFNADGSPVETRFSNRWYNWDLKALKEETINQETGEVSFGYVHVGPIMYMYQPAIGVCVPAPIGWAPVSPDWLQAADSIYLGNQTVVYEDGQTFFSQHWNRPDPISGDNHEMWNDLATGRPAKMEAEAPGGSRSRKEYLVYEEVRTEDPRVGADVFAFPSYCRQRPRTEDTEEFERLKKLIFRFDYW